MTYLWRGVVYSGAEALSDGVDGDIAESIARIRAQATPFGSLRIILPRREPLQVENDANPDAASEVQQAIAHFHQVFDQAHVTALQTANLFTTIDAETGSVAIADPGGGDFVVWFYGRWHLRYRQGTVFDFNENSDLAVWTNNLRGLALLAMREGGRVGLVYGMVNTGGPNGRHWFTFAGKRYDSIDVLAPAMVAAFDAAGREVHPVDDRIGGSVKIVIPLHPNLLPLRNLGVSALDDYRRGQEAYFDAVTVGQLEAIRRGKLFGKVDIETDDVADVAIGDNAVTLWRPSATPWRWLYRVAGKSDAHAFVSPPPSASLQQWVEALRDQIREDQ